MSEPRQLATHFDRLESFFFCRCILAFLIKKYRHAVASREKSKSELLQGINRFRIAYREIGKRMTLEGCIPEEELVFHFTHEELKYLLNHRCPVLFQRYFLFVRLKESLYIYIYFLVFRAHKRKHLYERWNQLHFPELNYGIPQPEPAKEKLDFFDSERERVKLQGTPACHGTVIGKACVITDIKDTKFIQQGDSTKKKKCWF